MGDLTVADLLDRCAAAGVPLRLSPDGRIHARRAPPADLAALVRAHREAIAAELRRRAADGASPVASTVRTVRTVPVPDTAPDAAGELAACAREGELLRRVQTGLGAEIDATLWRVLDHLLAARELPLADALWQHVVAADRRGIYSRLVGWLRALDAAGADLARVRVLVESGPGRHAYHDAGQP